MSSRHRDAETFYFNDAAHRITQQITRNDYQSLPKSTEKSTKKRYFELNLRAADVENETFVSSILFFFS